MHALTEDVVSVPNRYFHFQAGGWCQVATINFLKGNICESYTVDTCININFFFGNYFLSPLNL
jgi:hypothetical protein